MTGSRSWRMDPRVSRAIVAVPRRRGQTAPAYRRERCCSRYCGRYASKNGSYRRKGRMGLPTLRHYLRQVPDSVHHRASFERRHNQHKTLYYLWQRPRQNGKVMRRRHHQFLVVVRRSVAGLGYEGGTGENQRMDGLFHRGVWEREMVDRLCSSTIRLAGIRIVLLYLYVI